MCYKCSPFLPSAIPRFHQVCHNKVPLGHRRVRLQLNPRMIQLKPPRIGAGTGLFTRALLAHSDWSSSIARLRAVEPSEGMRGVWTEKNTEEKATIEDGTFESTAIPDGWADLVFVAQVSSTWGHALRLILSLVVQAFHWCPDYDKACAEFARILKKDGAVVFIWNLEDRQVLCGFSGQ